MSPPLVAFLGAGSVGSSAAALLSLTPVVGLADVVDPDRFLPLRNAYRCPAVAAGESGPKVEWVARVLRQAGWGARPSRHHLADWAATRSEPGYNGIALVSVDNVEARRDAAELQAQTTLTAGVSGAALHVHRHLAGDELACPYCELVDARHWREQAAVYARVTGLTTGRVLELMGGATLTADDVATAVWTGCVAPRAVDQLTRGSARLADLVAQHYAAVAVRDRATGTNGADGTSGRSGIAAPPDAIGTPRGQVVSAPHVSWLAGTLLAAEVVKAAIGLPGLDRRVDLDLTGVPLGGWRRPARDPSGRCLCANPVRRHLARALYDTR